MKIRQVKFRGFSPRLTFIILLILMEGCAIQRAYPSGVYHQVKRGEYLGRIARTYKVDMKTIMTANRLSDPNKLRVGQRLFIPGAKKVLGVDTYRTSAVSLKKNSFIWPVNSKRVTSSYGMRNGRQHKGIDIAASKGARIVASQSGTVVYAGTLSGYGEVIIIDHHNGHSTIYAHNSLNLVKVDDQVRQRQVIGRVGSTGRSTGPHLHFEIRKGYQTVNPLDYLP
ncbi:MAG: peptidoglycan DD-metalloendopeptidase family protein [Nitrospirae bacterium]|nr:peptidoglycan DD-metalloendopeptidase family protein [Nitrospirota bacterium]